VAELERDYATEFTIEDGSLYSYREILESELNKDYAEEKIIFADGKLLLRGEFFDIDERILDVEKGQAKGKIDRVETSLGNLILEAPIGGMVIYRKSWNGSTVSVGDNLWPGNVILSIVDPTETILKVDILEKDATGIEVGARALLRIDAHAERVFEGKVAEVSKLSRPIENGSPVKYFQAKISFDEGDPELLKPGMKGEVRIVVAELDDTVVVPRSAVHGNEGTYHVFLDGPDGPTSRPVELGPGDLVRVSVTAGLDGGERIVLGGNPKAAAAQPPAVEEASSSAGAGI
jgi:multidrug efflux pump subunit AcrA (membrane-fusion protein)